MGFVIAPAGAAHEQRLDVRIGVGCVRSEASAANEIERALQLGVRISTVHPAIYQQQEQGHEQHQWAAAHRCRSIDLVSVHGQALCLQLPARMIL